ncbi:MAG: dihydrofolate reductase family protein, partial [Rhodoluna sp.]
WRVNFAVNQAGESFGPHGSSDDVSSGLDRLLLGKLRSLADVIVTSGETARAEKYRSSKFAPIAIFTESGNLDSVPAIQGTQYSTPFVLTPSKNLVEIRSQLADVDVEIRGYDSSTIWPLEIARLLQHEGFQSPILESGLKSLRSFISSGVVGEICLTVTANNANGLSARNLSNNHLASLFGEVEHFELKNLFVSGNNCFSRWVHNGVAAG